MENEVVIKEEAALNIITETTISELIKPLAKEIILLDTYIAGTYLFLDTNHIELKEGDKLVLQRIKNETVEFDLNAISIYDMTGNKLGYVPENENTVLARLMDAGKCLSAQVTDVTPGENFINVEIRIIMTDF